MLLASAVTVAVILSVGLVGTVGAEEQPSWWDDMWNWCHGGGSGAGAGVTLDRGTLNGVAKVLGMDAQEIASQLGSGKSVFDIAAAKGAKEKIVDGVLAPYKDTLAIQVKYGYITQGDADNLLTQRQEWLNKVFAQTGSAQTNGGASRGFGSMMDSFGGIMGGFGGMMGGFGGMMGGSGGMMGGSAGTNGGPGGMMGGWGRTY